MATPLSTPDQCRVAVAQYAVSYFNNSAGFIDNLQSWVSEAVANDAQLLLFPEYAALELCSLMDKPLQSDIHGQLHAIQEYLPLFLEAHQKLAQQHQVTIVAGSFPVKITQAGEEVFVNRSYVFHPNGLSDFQDKHIMTRVEAEDWDIRPSTEIKIIDTAIGKIGISICYDSEFPLIARRQVEMGADLILVPSVTETLAGYHRVRTGSQARAMENQCYVLHAPLVGEAVWSPAIDISIGCAGVYTPMDEGFPANGILAQGEMNQSSWVYATLDFVKMRALRTNGGVLNYKDWDAQFKLL
ncbi:MAG: carbon-nitrogen hydrolase family protein [Marinomonas colpomeniae]